MQKYSIVMPVVAGTTGYDLFINVGLPSFIQFLDESVDIFYIVCPGSQISQIHNTLCDTTIPFSYIPEEDLLDPGVESVLGWFKQQLIKLNIATRIKTEHYLVIDSDMYLTQLLQSADLFYDSKIKYASEPWQTENSDLYSTNSAWWEGSCKALSVNIEMIKDDSHLMGVTPQTLLTSYVKKLLEFLYELYGDKWQISICDYKFTEFSLYWIFLLTNELTHLYTPFGYPLWIHNHTTNVLNPQSNQQMLKTVKESFTNPPSHFSVIQSYLLHGVDLSPFASDLAVYLTENKNRSVKYKAVFLIASTLNPKRFQSFSVEKRFKQTVKTVQSVRDRIPNAFCLLIEGSELPDIYKSVLSTYFDHILEYGNDDSVQTYVNDPRNIGHGELKLLEKGAEYIFRNRIRSEFMFKLGARYVLNDQFNIEVYDQTHYNFRAHFDSSINNYVYTTGLFSIPTDRLEEFLIFMAEFQNILTHIEPMVERVYYAHIPRYLVHEIKTLGLQGKLSYNKHFFKV